MNWLEPSLGSVQLYRIVEALLDTEVASYVWRDIRVIPTHVLRPRRSCSVSRRSSTSGW